MGPPRIGLNCPAHPTDPQSVFEVRQGLFLAEREPCHQGLPLT